MQRSAPSGPPRKKGRKPRCKVVVRDLPPTLPAAVFWESVARWVQCVPRADLDAALQPVPPAPGQPPTAVYAEYMPGQAATYVAMLTQPRVRRNADAGVDSLAFVDYALVPFVPTHRPARKDPLQGRWQELPEFQAFEATLTESPASEPRARPDTNADAVLTPLVQFVRDKHRDGAGGRGKQGAGPKGGPPDAAANSPAPKAGAPAPKAAPAAGPSVSLSPLDGAVCAAAGLSAAEFAALTKKQKSELRAKFGPKKGKARVPDTAPGAAPVPGTPDAGAAAPSAAPTSKRAKAKARQAAAAGAPPAASAAPSSAPAPTAAAPAAPGPNPKAKPKPRPKPKPKPKAKAPASAEPASGEAPAGDDAPPTERSRDSSLAKAPKMPIKILRRERPATSTPPAPAGSKGSDAPPS